MPFSERALPNAFPEHAKQIFPFLILKGGCSDGKGVPSTLEFRKRNPLHVMVKTYENIAHLIMTT